jgi:hypothetical protein
MGRETPRRALAAGFVVAALTLAGCTSAGSANGAVSTPSPTPDLTARATSTPVARPAPAGDTALAAVATLTVKTDGSMTGYVRSKFGPAWADVDHNGCDTRDDILRRDLTGDKIRADGCTVTAGTLHDPYTGKTIHFVRGTGTSTAVQIDHVVALGDAWATGASAWTATKRETLANDPLNLLAVDGPANEAKGDRDAAGWLPPNAAFDCAYVARQVAVKVKYGLWVRSAEKNTIARPRRLPEPDPAHRRRRGRDRTHH